VAAWRAALAQAADWCCRGDAARCKGTDELVLVPSSRSLIEFADRRFVMNRNSVYLIDCRKPFVLRSIEPPERIQVRLPRDELEQLMPIADVVNRPLPLQHQTALLASFVRGLIRIGPSTLNSAAAGLVRNHLIDLTAIALRSEDTVATTPFRPSCGNSARFRALHAKGLSEREIARKMGLHPIVVRAQRRRLGLAPNEGDDRDEALEIGWLALQLSLLPDVRGRQDLVEQLRQVLLLPPREPLEPENDPHDEGIVDDD